jgi:hypothetical protein
MSSMPIQEEPESTVGRRPDRFDHPEPHEQGGTRSGAAIRREEKNESETGGERERKRREPPTERGLEE